jgi:hypothetical protein
MPPGLKTHKPTAQMIRTAAVSSQKGRAPPIRISVYNALGKSRLLLGLLLEPHGFDFQTPQAHAVRRSSSAAEEKAAEEKQVG